MSTPSTMQWIRGAGTRVSTGSSRLMVHLARRAVAFGRRRYEAIAAWVGKSTGVWWLAKVAFLLLVASRARIVLFAVAERVNERAHSGAWGGLLFTAAGLWLIAAYRAGHPDWEPKQRPKPEEPADETGTEEQPDDAVEQLPDAAALPTFHQLCEALARVGTPHAHIAVIAEDLGTTPERVRDALDRCGVSVEPVRMRGRGSSTGIKGGSLPAPRPARDGVVAAGHPANNDNNTPDDLTQEGLRVEPIGLSGTVVRDPADIVRHHSVRHH
jgi:hypothetical protein